MSNNYFYPKDIIAAKAKCSSTPWLKLEPTKTRKSPSKQNPTYYIPFTAKNVAGKYIPLTVSFGSQVIASSAKPPYGVTPEEAKDVRILFRELTREDFEPTEYNEAKIDGLLANNKEFITALNIIADEYIALAEKEVLTYKGDKFKLTKTKTINCFRQTHRNAGEDESAAANDEGKVELPVPLFRLKLPADAVTKKIGNAATDKIEHGYIVYDMVKGTAVSEDGKTTYKPVVAKLKTSRGYIDLTISNAKNFITYMSLVGGKVAFDSICISKAGISLMCKIRDLHVRKHSQMKSEAMGEDMVNDMVSYGADLGDADEEIYDEPTDETEESPRSNSAKRPVKGAKPKTKTSQKELLKALDNDEDEVTVGNDEPDENDVDDQDDSNKQARAKQNMQEPVEDSTQDPDNDDAVEDSTQDPDNDEPVKKVKPPPKKPATGGNLKAGARRKKDT